jgi:putative hydrolase of the HAD superfamily
MIKNILFDFGAVLIPIQEERTRKAFQELGALENLAQQTELFEKLERGEISSDAFLTSLQAFFFRKTILKTDLAKAWNALCYEAIPSDNIRLIKRMAKDYSCFLLSNTNALHLEKIKSNSGRFSYNQFMKSFKATYLSHEMATRKPEAAFYQKVVDEHDLQTDECLFIDDRDENIEAAKAFGFKTWHFNPKKDNILLLNKKLKTLAD